jgi:hypothetical protein
MRRLQLADGSSMFRFLVGEELVTTGPGVEKDRVTLVVDDALAIAERCWDAGFEVRVRGTADATSVVVVDPFDRELEVISAITNGNPGRMALRVPDRAARLDLPNHDTGLDSTRAD